MLRSAAMELLLIRHGLPERIERDDGEPADPPLAPEGVEQARRVARYLDALKIDGILSSPMRRAFETAVPLAERKSLEVEVADLREMDAHSERYIPMEQLKAENYEEWKRVVQGGLYADIDPVAFRNNVVDVLEAAIDRFRGGRVAVFCHGGVINAWAGHVLGIDDPLFLDARYTSVHRFLAASSGERSVTSLNESAHLRGDLFPSWGDAK